MFKYTEEYKTTQNYIDHLQTIILTNECENLIASQEKCEPRKKSAYKPDDYQTIFKKPNISLYYNHKDWRNFVVVTDRTNRYEPILFVEKYNLQKYLLLSISDIDGVNAYTQNGRLKGTVRRIEESNKGQNILKFNKANGDFSEFAYKEMKLEDFISQIEEKLTNYDFVLINVTPYLKIKLSDLSD